jgi:hypothetical protein
VQPHQREVAGPVAPAPALNTPNNVHDRQFAALLS